MKMFTLKNRASLAGGILMALLAVPARSAEAPPARIVAAGGVVTEIIHALGAAAQIVGVDSTSQHPPEMLREKRNVGYVRALSAEGILSLQPDLVLAIDGAGPPDTIRLLREAKLRVATIPEDLTAEGVIKRIRAVGQAIGAPERAEALALEVEERFRLLETARRANPATRRALFVLSMQNGRVMVGGRNSSAGAILALAGLTNAAELVEGFKPLSDEGVIAAAPDIIVMMSRGDHAAKAEEVFAHPAFSSTPAARNRALVTMDGLYLLGFGPRTPDAAFDLMRAAHQTAGAPVKAAAP